MPLLARGPGFGIKKISVLLALVTYFSMMQSKILSENWVFLSTFHRCFRRNFNPVYFQMVSGSVGSDSHTQQLVKGPVIRSLFNHKVEQVILRWGPIISRKGVPAVAFSSVADTRILLPAQILHILDACYGYTCAQAHRTPDHSML